MSRTDPFAFGVPPHNPNDTVPDPPKEPASGVTPAAAARLVPDAILDSMENGLGGRPRVNVVETPETHGENGARYAGMGVAVPRERVNTEPLSNIIVAKTPEPAERPSTKDVGSVGGVAAGNIREAETVPKGRPATPAKPASLEEAVAGGAARDIQREAAKRIANLASEISPTPAPQRMGPTYVSVHEKRNAVFGVVAGVVIVALLGIGLWIAYGRTPAVPTPAPSALPPVSVQAPTAVPPTPPTLVQPPSTPTLLSPTLPTPAPVPSGKPTHGPSHSSPPQASAPIVPPPKASETAPKPSVPTVPPVQTSPTVARPMSTEVPPF